MPKTFGLASNFALPQKQIRVKRDSKKMEQPLKGNEETDPCKPGVTLNQVLIFLGLSFLICKIKG